MIEHQLDQLVYTLTYFNFTCTFIYDECPGPLKDVKTKRKKIWDRCFQEDLNV